MNHDHLFLTQPVNEYRATHPLNLSSPLAIFFSLSHYICTGPYSSLPLFSATSSGACFPALFFILGGFYVFFNILSVLAVLQYSLCSSPFSRSPPLCRGSAAQFLQELLTPVSEPGHHLLLFICLVPLSNQSVLFLFCFLSQDHVCCRCFRCCLLQMILASTLPL